MNSEESTEPQAAESAEAAEPSAEDVSTEQQYDGTDYVDFDSLKQGEVSPDDVKKLEARFKRIYGNLKEYERTVAQMGQDNRAILEKLNQIESDTATTKKTSRIENLKAQKVAALEEGNHALVADLDDQIAELRAVDTKPKPLPKKEQEVTSIGALSADDEATLQAWANETDGSGNPKRPWAQPNHPKYQRAVNHLVAVAQDDDFPDVNDILEEVDRLMMPKNGTRTQAAVLPGGNEPRKSGDKIALSPVQKRVAEAMFDDMNPKDAHARYAKAMKETAHA